MRALPSVPSKKMASWPQLLAQAWHLRHLSSATTGLPALCCSILPARLPQPMPMFLRAPPKPVASWPLKWLRLMKMSASITARPILASFTYSPPTTGTATSSVPFTPSPMMTWQPVEKGVKPFS